jgi:hypothetical protein
MATEREREKERDKPPKDATKNDRPLSPLQRAVQTAMGEHREFGAADDSFAEKYPLMWELMSSVEVGRDYVKEPASMRITLGPGGVLVTLSDRNFRLAWDTQCEHLAGVWDAMEARLADPTRPGRPVGKGEPELRKRKSRS